LSLPGCGQKSECVLPKGDNNSSDNYAKLGTKGGVTLSFAPCYENRFPRESGIYGRMKNPDTMDGSHQAWSSAENVCNAGDLAPANEKCKHYNQLISCERRGWKEDCEQTETGCSMYEGGSCCSWDDQLSMCTKNTQHCNRHTSLAECNSDPSKMCRWGPDEENSTDKRKPGCYPNKGFQDSYLNTMDNTCRSPQFFDKNMMWQRTGSQDSDGFEKCQMVQPPKNPENPQQYFASKEECEGKMKPKPPSRFACVSIDQDDNLIEGSTCTQLPETMHWDGATYSSKEACEVGTNYCTTIKDCRVLCTDEQCERDHCPQSHMFPYLCTTGPEKSGCNSHVHGWEESSQCHGCCDSSVCV
jgi:hypothetical protein